MITAAITAVARLTRGKNISTLSPRLNYVVGKSVALAWLVLGAGAALR
jgi:hypothetical protein